MLNVDSTRPQRCFAVGLNGFADKNLRCGLGGFAVRKTGSCVEHEFKKASGRG